MPLTAAVWNLYVKKLKLLKLTNFISLKLQLDQKLKQFSGENLSKFRHNGIRVGVLPFRNSLYTQKSKFYLPLFAL